jgi:hypothetical protein
MEGDGVMLQRVLPLGIALTLFVGVAVAVAADKDKPAADTHTGKFVSFADGKLTMVGDDGKEHSHTLNKDVKVTIDGKDAKMDDLKTVAKDTALAVTLDKDTVTRIDVNPKPAKDKEVKDKK